MPFDEANPSPIIRFDESLHVLKANRAASVLLGARGAAATTLHPLVPEGVVERLGCCVSEGGSVTLRLEVEGKFFDAVAVGFPEHGVAHLYAADVTRYEGVSERSERIHAEHQRQLKELSCIYGLAESICVRETVESICQDVVQLLPAAWRHPEIARARIVLDDVEYVSEVFEITKWGQSAAIIVDEVARGMVQVFYTEDRRAPGEDGPFLPAERQLLDAVARTLGEAIARRGAEAENREKTITLARERNRLESILRAIGEGVVVTDSGSRVVLMNRAAQRLFRIEEELSLGADFLSLVKDEEFKERWRATARTGEEFSKVDLSMKGLKPRLYWATRSPIHGVGHGEIWYVTILQDVTKEREIDQMKTDFVSAVSHELRTPMTSVKGFVATLLNKPSMDPELRNRFLSIIDEEADRLIILIEELLLIARIESGHVLLEREPVDLARVMERVVSSLRHLAEAKGIRLRHETPKDLGRPLGDVKKIHTVLQNLVVNAIKFTGGGGLVKLSAHGSEGEVTLRVEDTGVGIEASEQERIFERFYRVHRDGEMESGAGLGLFIVSEMVRLHGGRIDLESTPGKGTVFTVHLPLVAPVSRPQESA